MATDPVRPTSTPLTILQGATFTLPITVYDNNGTAIDLTGYTIHMQIKANPGAGSAFLDLSTTSGGIAISGTKATITATATQTTALDFGVSQTAYYDVKFTAPNGTVSRWLQGPVRLDPQITV